MPMYIVDEKCKLLQFNQTSEKSSVLKNCNKSILFKLV